jgi:hypothetical protein
MAIKANLVIDQGATFSVDFNLTDENDDVLNLNGFTSRSQMRKWYTSSNAAATFTTSIDVDTGVVTLELTAVQTSGITAGRYVYDVELINGAVVSRVVEGVVTVTPEVTRNG